MSTLSKTAANGLDDGETLSAEAERRLYRRIDVMIITMSQLVATHGGWAEFVTTLLQDFAEGREAFDRVLMGSPAELDFFRSNYASLRRQMQQALKAVSETFYGVSVDEVLAPFLEPGCSTSPISYVVGPDGRVSIEPNRDVLMMVNTNSRADTAARRLLMEHIEAQKRLMRLVWHLPLKPNYLLERVEDFGVQISRYRDQVVSYRAAQRETINRDGAIGMSATHNEERHRHMLWGLLRGARLFPADMMTLQTRLVQLQKGILDIQGVVVTKGLWMVKVAYADYRWKAQEKNVSAHDFEAEGLAHMAKLMRTFNWRLGNRFSAYARRDVTSHLRDWLASNGGPMRMASAAGRDVDRVRAVYMSLSETLGRPASIQEVAGETGLKHDMCRDLMMVAGGHISLQSPASKEGGTLYADLIADETSILPAQGIETSDSHTVLYQLLETLPNDEQLALTWKFSLNGAERLPEHLIAQRLSLPPTAVPGLLARGIQHLRQSLEKSPAAGEVFARRLLATLLQRDGDGGAGDE